MYIPPFNNKLYFGNYINKGKVGKVYKLKNNDKFVVKEAKLNSCNEKILNFEEKDIHKLIKNNISPNFSPLLSYNIKSNICYKLYYKYDNTLEYLILNENIDINILKSCLFQIWTSIFIMYHHFNFIHADLKTSNIMYIKNIKNINKYWLYNYNNNNFYIKNYGYQIKIIDFDNMIDNNNLNKNKGIVYDLQMIHSYILYDIISKLIKKIYNVNEVKDIYELYKKNNKGKKEDLDIINKEPFYTKNVKFALCRIFLYQYLSSFYNKLNNNNDYKLIQIIIFILKIIGGIPYLIYSENRYNAIKNIEKLNKDSSLELLKKYTIDINNYNNNNNNNNNKIIEIFKYHSLNI
jgi:hypothetical protein